MCGIAGFICFSSENASTSTDGALLDRMVDTLKHRGPDGGGCLGIEATSGLLRTWSPGEAAGNVGLLRLGLGNRRLKIIDLSRAGHQPMANEDSTIWLVHNGEIYNYRELRAELLARGHSFRSQTDTEVIIHAYDPSSTVCRETKPFSIVPRDMV